MQKSYRSATTNNYLNSSSAIVSPGLGSSCHSDDSNAYKNKNDERKMVTFQPITKKRQRQRQRKDMLGLESMITTTNTYRLLYHPPFQSKAQMITSRNRMMVWIAACYSLALLITFASGLQIHGSAHHHHVVLGGRIHFNNGGGFSGGGSTSYETSSSTTSLKQAFSNIQSSTFISSKAILQSQFDIPEHSQNLNYHSHSSSPSSSSSYYYFGTRLTQERYYNNHHHPNYQRGLITMGKGDGKKKRKKSSAASSSSSSSSAASTPPKPTPLRVSTNINIPVKRQLMYAKLHKEYSAQGSPGYKKKKVERTKYRRTWDEEEIEQKAEERRRKGQDPNWDVILNRTAVSPLVIVDGYNIIHRWARLKKHMNKGDPQRARELLIDDLENLRSLKGWRIEVVFDGTGRSSKGPLGDGPRGSTRVTAGDRSTNKDISKHGVRVVFTGVGVEADSYIEARCAKAKNVTSGTLTGSFIVATDDAMIRLAGQSAGAWCMGATRFVDELKAVKKATGYRVEAAMAKVNGHAIRPEKLRGTSVHRFGRGSVIIEDKRNRTKTKKKDEVAYELDLDLKVDEDENGVPWWAKVPNQTVVYRKSQGS